MAHTGRRNADATLAAALAAGLTARQAALKAGVSLRTVFRRLKDERFRARVQEVQAEMVARTVGRLAAGQTEAATVLRKLLRAKSEAIRLGACRAMLELGTRAREASLMDVIRQLEERLAVVERRRGKMP